MAAPEARFIEGAKNFAKQALFLALAMAIDIGYQDSTRKLEAVDDVHRRLFKRPFVEKITSRTN